MKRFGLFFILSIVTSFFFTSCEKNEAEDDARFENIGEITAKIDGKDFISRNAVLELKRYEEVDVIQMSAIISGENVLGDRMTFHIGSVFPDTYLLSEPGEAANLYEFNAVTYKQSAESGGTEFSSKNMLPDPDNKLVNGSYLPEVSESGEISFIYNATFAYTAGNILEQDVVTVTDGLINVAFSKEQWDQYLALIDEITAAEETP